MTTMNQNEQTERHQRSSWSVWYLPATKWPTLYAGVFKCSKLSRVGEKYRTILSTSLLTRVRSNHVDRIDLLSNIAESEEADHFVRLSSPSTGCSGGNVEHQRWRALPSYAIDIGRWSILIPSFIQRCLRISSHRSLFRFIIGGSHSLSSFGLLYQHLDSAWFILCLHERPGVK